MSHTARLRIKYRPMWRKTNSAAGGAVSPANTTGNPKPFRRRMAKSPSAAVAHIAGQERNRIMLGWVGNEHVVDWLTSAQNRIGILTLTPLMLQIRFTFPSTHPENFLDQISF